MQLAGDRAIYHPVVHPDNQAAQDIRVYFKDDITCTTGDCKLYPSIAYAGRLRKDPANQITLTDNYLWKGTGSQYDTIPLPNDDDGPDGPWGTRIDTDR